MSFKEDYWKEKQERKALSEERTKVKLDDFMFFCKSFFAPSDKKIVKKHVRSLKERIARRSTHRARLLSIQRAI